VEPADLSDELELGESKLMTALTRLEEAGAVEIRPDGRVRSLGVEPEHVEQAMEGAEDRRAFDRSRLEMMRAYAEHEHCRRAFILSYFGEPYERACGNCDNCEAGRGLPDEGGEPFGVGTRVVHDDWDEGVVQRYAGDQMVVLFDSVGYKTLSVELVAERGLLKPA
jgi:ATP-dependent DNA helicase RecQ